MGGCGSCVRASTARLHVAERRSGKDRLQYGILSSSPIDSPPSVHGATDGGEGVEGRGEDDGVASEAMTKKHPRIGTIDTTAWKAGKEDQMGSLPSVPAIVMGESPTVTLLPRATASGKALTGFTTGGDAAASTSLLHRQLSSSGLRRSDAKSKELACNPSNVDVLRPAARDEEPSEIRRLVSSYSAAGGSSGGVTAAPLTTTVVVPPCAVPRRQRQSLLSYMEQYRCLQTYLPPSHRNRRWRLVYSSDVPGAQLRERCQHVFTEEEQRWRRLWLDGRVATRSNASGPLLDTAASTGVLDGQSASEYNRSHSLDLTPHALDPESNTATARVAHVPIITLVETDVGVSTAHRNADAAAFPHDGARASSPSLSHTSHTVATVGNDRLCVGLYLPRPPQLEVVNCYTRSDVLLFLFTVPLQPSPSTADAPVSRSAPLYSAMPSTTAPTITTAAPTTSLPQPPYYQPPFFAAVKSTSHPTTVGGAPSGERDGSYYPADDEIQMVQRVGDVAWKAKGTRRGTTGGPASVGEGETRDRMLSVSAAPSGSAVAQSPLRRCSSAPLRGSASLGGGGVANDTKDRKDADASSTQVISSPLDQRRLAGKASSVASRNSEEDQLEWDGSDTFSTRSADSGELGGGSSRLQGSPRGSHLRRSFFSGAMPGQDLEAPATLASTKINGQPWPTPKLPLEQNHPSAWSLELDAVKAPSPVAVQIPHTTMALARTPGRLPRSGEAFPAVLSPSSVCPFDSSRPLGVRDSPRRYSLPARFDIDDTDASMRRRADGKDGVGGSVEPTLTRYDILGGGLGGGAGGGVAESTGTLLAATAPSTFELTCDADIVSATTTIISATSVPGSPRWRGEEEEEGLTSRLSGTLTALAAAAAGGVGGARGGQDYRKRGEGTSNANAPFVGGVSRVSSAQGDDTADCFTAPLLTEELTAVDTDVPASATHPVSGKSSALAEVGATDTDLSTKSRWSRRHGPSTTGGPFFLPLTLPMNGLPAAGAAAAGGERLYEAHPPLDTTSAPFRPSPPKGAAPIQCRKVAAAASDSVAALVRPSTTQVEVFRFSSPCCDTTARDRLGIDAKGYRNGPRPSLPILRGDSPNGPQEKGAKAEEAPLIHVFCSVKGDLYLWSPPGDATWTAPAGVSPRGPQEDFRSTSEAAPASSIDICDDDGGGGGKPPVVPTEGAGDEDCLCILQCDERGMRLNVECLTPLPAAPATTTAAPIGTIEEDFTTDAQSDQHRYPSFHPVSEAAVHHATQHALYSLVRAYAKAQRAMPKAAEAHITTPEMLRSKVVKMQLCAISSRPMSLAP